MKSESVGKLCALNGSGECQNSDRQLEGIEVDEIFLDKASGRDSHREELEAIIDYFRPGFPLLETKIKLDVNNLGREGSSLAEFSL